MNVLRIIVIAISTVLLSACSTTGTNPDTTSTIIYGLTSSVSGIDPHLHQGDEVGMILRQIYDTLVYRDPVTREFVSGLARSWDVSEDGLTYTLRLRDDVVFHDGTKFNAEAVSLNFSRILDPNLGSQFVRFLLGPIISYQVVDSYTFRITLSEPFAPLLDSLSQVYLSIASPQAIATYEETPLRYQYHQVGTGPFRLVEYVPEDRIVLERNENYIWGPEFYGNTVPENAVNRVEFRFFLDGNDRFTALQEGRVDVIGGILPSDGESIVASSEYVLYPVQIPGEPIQFYVNTQASHTDNLGVRQALLYASNRTSIADGVYRGFSSVAWGPISGNTLFYNRGVENAYAQNVAQAQELLTRAGYGDSDLDGILDRDGIALRIKLIQPPWGLLPQVVPYLQDQWRSLGIDVVVQPVPGYTALLQEIQSDDYHLVATDRHGLDPWILNLNYLSASNENWSNITNSELDELLIRGLRTSDAEERRQAYGRAQAIIMEQAIVIPITDYVLLTAHSVRISGLTFDASGLYPLLYGVTLR